MIETLSLATDVMRAFGLGAVRAVELLGGTATRKWSVVTTTARESITTGQPVRLDPAEWIR